MNTIVKPSGRLQKGVGCHSKGNQRLLSGSFLFAVLVSSCLEGRRANIITIAWTGVMSSSHQIILVSPGKAFIQADQRIREYVINIPSANQIKMVDYCGVVNRKDVNKFKETGLTLCRARARRH